MQIKQEQIQRQTQHLSAQQVHLLKLVALPNHAVDSYVEEVMGENPALEEDADYQAEALVEESEVRSYAPQSVGRHAPLEWVEYGLRSEADRQSYLLEQLRFLDLEPTQHRIGEQIIGSLDDGGYLRRPAQALANDLLVNENVEVSEEDIEAVLRLVQRFDPPGIASRTLQECLLLQLERQPSSSAQTLAHTIIDKHYQALTHKHQRKLQERLKVAKEALQEALQLIKRLTPTPGGISKQIHNGVVIADFSVHLLPNKIVVRMLRKPRRWARVSNSYQNLYKQFQHNKYKKDKEVQQFVRKQVEAAQSFVQALHTREATLLKVVQLIANHQRTFLESGDRLHLKPLILKDIAEQVHMDISTISRIVNRKYMQTDWGVFPLREFFSQALKGQPRQSKQTISNAHIKEVVRRIIDQEDKHHPLSDEQIEHALQTQGYSVARRTIAKYREQLHIPVARLRKESP